MDSMMTNNSTVLNEAVKAVSEKKAKGTPKEKKNPLDLMMDFALILSNFANEFESAGVHCDVATLRENCLSFVKGLKEKQFPYTNRYHVEDKLKKFVFTSPEPYVGKTEYSRQLRRVAAALSTLYHSRNSFTTTLVSVRRLKASIVCLILSSDVKDEEWRNELAAKVSKIA